jgi:hypothetical protein
MYNFDDRFALNRWKCSKNMRFQSPRMMLYRTSYVRSEAAVGWTPPACLHLCSLSRQDGRRSTAPCLLDGLPARLPDNHLPLFVFPRRSPRTSHPDRFILGRESQVLRLSSRSGVGLIQMSHLLKGVRQHWLGWQIQLVPRHFDDSCHSGYGQRVTSAKWAVRTWWTTRTQREAREKG